LFNATTFNYQVNDDFNLIYKVGLDTYTEKQAFKLNNRGIDFPNGFYTTLDISNRIWDHSVIGSYSKSLSDKISIGAKIGGNMRNDVFNFNVVTGENMLARGLFRHQNFIDITSSEFLQEETRMGIFGELTADINNYLFLNVAGRNDWTSTVEPENRRIFYPSGSVAFVPTSAFKGLESNFLNFLKIRAGVGTSAGFPQPYRTRNILQQNARGFLNAAGATVQTHSVDNFLGNPNLLPELQTEFEFGVEGKILNNKIGFDLTLFRRDTRNLITNTPLDASTGYTSTSRNIGKIRNEGIELSVNGTAIKTDAFGWDVNFVYSRIVPTVLDLGEGLSEIQMTGFGGALGNYAVVGQPFGVIKGTGFRRNDQGQLLIDGGGYLQATTAPVILGDPNPAFTSSLINSFTYKGFTLDVMLSYRHGGAMYSSTAGALLGRGMSVDTGLENGYDRAQTFIFPGVKADGTPNDIQITASDVGFNNISFFGDEGRMYDATTIRLQEISLAYQLPRTMLSKIGFKGASIALNGNNLWYKALNFPPGLNFDTDNLGLGVGNGQGFEFLTGPSARRFGATLKLTF
jgi:outer membrane receptor protein involved in Fe transport